MSLFDPSAEERRLLQPGGRYWWYNLLWFLGLHLENDDYIERLTQTWRALAGPARLVLATDESGVMTLTAAVTFAPAADQQLRAGFGWRWQ